VHPDILSKHKLLFWMQLTMTALICTHGPKPAHKCNYGVCVLITQPHPPTPVQLSQSGRHGCSFITSDLQQIINLADSPSSVILGHNIIFLPEFSSDSSQEGADSIWRVLSRARAVQSLLAQELAGMWPVDMEASLRTIPT